MSIFGGRKLGEPTREERIASERARMEEEERVRVEKEQKFKDERTRQESLLSQTSLLRSHDFGRTGRRPTQVSSATKGLQPMAQGPFRRGNMQ